MRELELYVHIPFCVKKCDYCDFLSFPAEENLQWKYVSALMKEVQYYGDVMQEYEVTTVYIGGGTPSCLDEAWMVRILDVIGDYFHVRRDAEVSIECNPGTVTGEKLQAYLANGINRLSIGLQSTHNDELRLLGRIHSFDQFLRTYEIARGAGFRNINVDLMSAIPEQTLEKYAESLLRVIRLKPEHISAYSLIIEEGTPFYDRYKFDRVMQEAGLETKHLPNEEVTYNMMKATQQLCEKYGYRRYEISNYARAGYECRHNIGYWDRAEYLGVGIGAASLIGNIRYSNTRDIQTYIENSKKIELQQFGETIGTNLHESAVTLTKQEEMEEFMYLGLRKVDGVARDEFLKHFHTPIQAVYRDVMRKLQNQGLLELQAGRVFLTDRGLDLSNYAMAQFLL